jgi:hypothetical protein
LVILALVVPPAGVILFSKLLRVQLLVLEFLRVLTIPVVIHLEHVHGGLE